MPQFIEHPAVTAVGFTGLAALIVWLVKIAGYDMPPAVAATIAGIIVSFGFAVRSYGIKELARTLWKGVNGK